MALDPYSLLTPLAMGIAVASIGWMRRQRGPPRNEPELLFFLFFWATFLFGVFDFLMRTSDDAASARGWYRMVLLTIVFAPMLFHFTLVFPRPRKLPVARIWILLPAYIAGVLFSAYFALVVGEFVREFRQFPWGLHPVPRPISELPSHVLAPFLAIMLLVLLSLVNLVSSFRSARNPQERKQIHLLILAIPMNLFFYTLFSLLLPASGVFTPLMGSASLLFSTPLISVAIHRYKFLLAPVAEPVSPAPAAFTLGPGQLYLAKEERPRRVFDAFKDLVTHGTHGLVLTRTHPRKVRENIGLDKTPVLWLGETSPQEGVPALDSLEELNYTVAKFAKDSGNSVVLLDGLEYLVQRNDFAKVLKMVYHLKEIVARNNGRLLLPVDPRTLDDRQMALLERETEPLP
ncbi:MAG: DUF835 domain-containing protein [Halobacteria archaeon]